MIPKTINMIWLGSAFPSRYLDNVLSYRRLNPSWSVKVWQDADMYPLGNDLDRAMADPKMKTVFKTDIMRYRIIADHGGIYVDTDTKCVKPLDPLLERDFICAYETPSMVGCAVVGGPAGCPVCKDMNEALISAYHDHDFHFAFPREAVQVLGPALFTRVVAKRGVAPFPKDYFYPGGWHDRAAIREMPETYIVHYFDGMAPDGWTRNL
jgi:mannosyltransferase OCH1-like enzyme